MSLTTKTMESIMKVQPLNLLVTGNTTTTGAGDDASTKVTFKNCSPFARCVTHISYENVETAEYLDNVMNMYNLIEYFDNYAILLEVYGNSKEMNKI